MKVFLDTCAFNWIVDDPRGSELLTVLQSNRVDLFLPPEIATEIHKTPNAKRHKDLLNVILPFGPLQPTRVPISGIMRSGLAIAAPSNADALWQQLKAMSVRKLDVIHLMNAHYSRCEVFVTRDRRTILKRKAVLGPLLNLAIVTPDEFLSRVAKHASSLG